MALVKYITKPISSSTINDVLELDNKELLLISLLEKLCQTLDGEHKLFKTICQYLNKIGIIEDRQLYSDKKKMIRKMYSDYLIKLIGECHESRHKINGLVMNDENGSHDGHDGHDSHDSHVSLQSLDKLLINNSLYTMNFIELEKLGSGGFGEVYKVYNKIDTQKYAVKIIPFVDVNDPNNVRAFNEVRCLSQLSHDNVARYYTSWLELSDKNKVDETDEINVSVYPIFPIMYIQMELCIGNLRDFLIKRNYCGIMSGDDMKIEKQIINGIIKGLTYIHENNILHRDLNPNNIFLDSNLNPKIGDFGMSVKIDKNDSDNQKLSSNYGICLYMPPEYEKDNIYTMKSDVYSAGMICFEILNQFKTDMERYHVLSEIKNNLAIEKHNLTIVKYISGYEFIIQMIDIDPNQRPNCHNIRLEST